MTFVLNAARKDLQRHLRDPLALVLWLAIPLAVGLVISLAVGGRSGPQPVAHLLVADQDGSFVSGLLVNALSQGPGEGLIQTEAVERVEGRRRLDAGEGSALLVIPAGFGQALLKEDPTRLELVTNPSQNILPAIIEETLGALTELSFYLHRLFGEQLAGLFAEGLPADESGFPDGDIAKMAVGINQTMGNVQKYLLPPAFEVKISSDEHAKTQKVSLAVLFLPGLLIMALLFMAQGLAEDIWQERDQGTLRRAVSSPGGVIPLLGGKLVASSCVLLLASLIVLALGIGWLDLPWTNLPLGAAWATLAGAVFFLAMLLVQLYASSRRAGSILTSAFVFPLLMLGGSFFPAEVMPRWMAAVGAWTPNGWALGQLKDILLERVEPLALVTGAANLVVVGLVCFLLSCRRARRVSAEGS